MKVAVIGSGAAGLGAALALSERHDVRLFEKDARFGGHANTVEVEYDGVRLPVDTGFIVFNEKNYPNLTAMFEALGVASEESDMSFGVSLDDGRLEYACDNLDKVFAQRWRAFDPSYWRCFMDIMRFNREAPRALAAGELDGLSLAEWLESRRFCKMMRENFVLAMGAAIWSTPAHRMAQFPARSFVQFFVNHELLNGLGPAIQWRTVSGGSREYVRRAIDQLGERARAGAGAVSVARRLDGRVVVTFEDGSEEHYDHVVLATHPDQSLALMADADAEERALLGAIRYADNVAVLHRDPGLMPRRRKVWSSWSVLAESGADARPSTLTYWMNRLQNLDPARPLFVSLNPPRDPEPELTFARFNYAHPLFDQAAFDAQAGMDQVQGRGGIWHAGAWLGWGFHEDALKAGLRVAAALGARPTWAVDIGQPLTAPMAIAAE
ncbi:MAG: FAD-dependent oxidoreductase [Rhodobacteraceae bacterium]|nr:FAD-dependent oxidoreductase [Paracoccaceae bacterium]